MSVGMYAQAVLAAGFKQPVLPGEWTVDRTSGRAWQPLGAVDRPTELFGPYYLAMTVYLDGREMARGTVLVK